jgi:DNA repair exonuclease SbcCD ATPase subunit
MESQIKKFFAFLVVAVFLMSMVAAIGPQQIRQTQNVEIKNMEELKNKIKGCREGKITNETACEVFKRQGIEVAKARIVEVFDAKIARLNELKERILANENLSDEEKKIIVERIDKLTTRLEVLKQNLPDNATELRKAVQEFREEREKFVEEHRLIVEKIKEKRVGLIVERAEHLVKKLERWIEKYNASDLENLTQQFYEKIQKANQSRNEAIGLWKELHERIKNKNITANEIRQYVRDIHQKLEEAKSYLKEAKEILKEIWKEIKEIRKKETEVNETQTE